MTIKVVCVLIMFCAMIETTFSERGDGRYGQGYTRIKRGKYPSRYFSRPSVGIPKGAFSHTPPPNYMRDVEPAYPGYRPKVSKKPSDGLGDEDLQNFVKYLSKNDLDKIIQLAGTNQPDQQEFKNYGPTTDAFKSIYNSIQDVPERYLPKEDETKIFNSIVQEIDLDPKIQEKPDYANLASFKTDQKHKEYSVINYVAEQMPNQYASDQKPEGLYSQYPYVTDVKPNEHTILANYVNDQIHNDYPANYATQSIPLKAFYSPNKLLYTEEALPINQNGDFTDSKLIPEDDLPKPMNLRDDFEVSFTNNVPTVVKTDGSYKVEDFGALPLMNYNSKLDSLSSYHVPHYTVTSSKSSSYSAPSSSYSAPSSSSYSSSKIPAVDPAPPSSSAKGQSDAHLKAVRIWSHKSKGTAYTLHDDGTLSLERPAKPKGTYGYP